MRIVEGDPFDDVVPDVTWRDVRRMRRIHKLLDKAFYESFALPSRQYVNEFIRALDSAIESASETLERMEGEHGDD